MSARTPEGKVKARITALLKRIPNLWYTTPIGNTYGNPSLDFVGVYRGLFFAIEAKANGLQPTARQLYTMNQIRSAGGLVFLVNDEASFIRFRSWIESLA